VNESVIDVLIYLYEHYMDGESAVPDDQILLEEELVQAGFPKLQIKKAFDWLDELAWRQGSLEYRKGPNQSIRVYTEEEQDRLDVEIQGLLLYLEQNGILDPFSRELVIERAMALDTRELSVDDVKWIALLVLMNQPDQESALELMEEFVYHGDSGTLH
jgi:Smg protein